ncbi:phage BR0599 family protein [Paenirhodobacter populi]|uniref:phage BR0599 family protein n=1 Tax=Paenirhodobacter populi TaxID=2306993 RepID=UPI0013E2CAA7|nr:phage BR0599 family protein [Sinirhodobacter populi]
MSDLDFSDNGIETGDVAFIVTVTGDGETWRYTNCDTELMDAQSNAYLAVPMKIGTLSSDGDMGGGEVDVTLPRTVSVASRFLPQTDRTIYNLQIRRALHVGGVITDTRIAFTGVIKMAAASGDEGESLVLKCSTDRYKLERNASRRRYQHSCPHVLYGSQCRALRELSALPARIEPILSAGRFHVVITFEPDDPDNPTVRGMDLFSDWETLKGLTFSFKGAEYQATRIERRLLLNFGVQVRADTASSLIAALISSSSNERFCTVHPNCDHTLNACQKMHRNAANFGGMPFIPFKNPVGTSFVG